MLLTVLYLLLAATLAVTQCAKIIAINKTKNLPPKAVQYLPLWIQSSHHHHHHHSLPWQCLGLQVLSRNWAFHHCLLCFLPGDLSGQLVCEVTIQPQFLPAFQWTYFSFAYFPIWQALKEAYVQLPRFPQEILMEMSLSPNCGLMVYSQETRELYLCSMYRSHTVI